MSSSQLSATSFSKEARELLQSLRKESAWGAELCLYQGFWFFSIHLEPLLLSQKNFQVTDTDVILVTSPKSGTTWLKSLLFAITKRFQFVPSDPNHPLLSTNPHELVPFLEILYSRDKNPNLSHMGSPRLFAAHTPYNMLPESVKAKCRIIYLCRDPKDIFVSMWQYANKSALPVSDGSKYSIPLEEAFDLFCRGITGTGPIWEHALEYWNVSMKDSDKVLFLKYEDLKDDIISQVKKLAEFTGCPFSNEEESAGVVEEIAKMCSFDSLSSLEVNKIGQLAAENKNNQYVFSIKNKDFFRKGEVGDWKNYITPSMKERLDQITEQKLLGSGLKFD